MAIGVQPTRSEILLSTIAPSERGWAVEMNVSTGLHVHRLRRVKSPPCEEASVRCAGMRPLTKDLSQASKGEDNANAILVQQLRKFAAPKRQLKTGKEGDVGPGHGLAGRGMIKLRLSWLHVLPSSTPQTAHARDP